jgi:hypothetical protein
MRDILVKVKALEHSVSLHEMQSDAGASGVPLASL